MFLVDSIKVNIGDALRQAIEDMHKYNIHIHNIYIFFYDTHKNK